MFGDVPSCNSIVGFHLDNTYLQEIVGTDKSAVMCTYGGITKESVRDPLLSFNKMAITLIN